MFDVSFSGVSSDNRGRILGVALLLMTLLATSESLANALETYVHKPDASFAWKRTEQKIKDLTLTHLGFISQTWRGHFWSHHLLVVRPTTVRQADVAMLFITGGSYNVPDEKETERFHEVAQRAGAVVAILNKVPNQPLYDGRKEDALIAFTFDQYLKTGDPTWPLLFPMVKSAVRATDTLQSFARQEFDQKIERFVVSGESKRGWTSWLTGAVDTRVVAIAPMAIDMLNMKAQFDWTEKMYGRQSDQISDYTDLNLHQKLDDPPMKTLRVYAAGRRARRGLGKPETFNFLGFTHICGRSSRGLFQLKRQTRRDRMRARLRAIKEELQRRMHEPIPLQGKWLRQVVRGYFAYHAVPTNCKALSTFRHYVMDLWQRALQRRSQRDRSTWERIAQLAREFLP